MHTRVTVQNTNEGKTDFVECNALLKLKFRILHERVVENVNADDVVDFLFEKGVLGPRDSRALQLQRNDQQQQCRELLALLHTSGHPKAFINLYHAIKKTTSLNWLTEEIDKCLTGKCQSKAFS